MDQEDVPLEGQIREKLVRTKERWAEEGRLLTGTTADPARGCSSLRTAAGFW